MPEAVALESPMADASPLRRPITLARLLLLATLTLYWIYLYVRVLLPAPDESVVAYWIAVLPVALAAPLGLLLQVAGAVHARRLRLGEVLLLSFVGIVTVVSVARGDLASLRSAGLLALALLWIDTIGTTVTVRVLNAYFVASIAGGGLWHMLGFSEYGLLPGQYADGADRGISWRVSLFPFVPESGFFALVVLLANQLHRRGATRLAFCAIAAYFVVLSGVRSALLALVLAQIYIFMRSAQRSSARSNTLLLVLLLAAFVGAITVSSLAAMSIDLPGGALGNFLFRTESVGDGSAALSQTIYRGWLWAQHLAMFASSPLAGIGTFEFQAVVTESLVEGKEDSGSEAFITAWLARLGLCALPLMAYLWLLCRRAAEAQGAMKGSAFIVLGVAAFAYGSFLVPYNFMFIVLVALLAAGRSQRPRRVSP